MPNPHQPIDAHALLFAAREAAQRAYVPYSSFRVGAAILCGDGTLITGCNVENASYGLSNCAERTALFAAVASGQEDFVAMAVSCIDGDVSQPSTLMPCGACRQVMSELLATTAVVLVDQVGEFAMSELLPHPFTL